MQRKSFYSAARANSAVAANGAIALQTVDFLQENHNRDFDAFLATPFEAFGQTHRLLLGASHILDEGYGGNSAFCPTKVSSVGRQNHYGEPRRVVVALKARY